MTVRRGLLTMGGAAAGFVVATTVASGNESLSTSTTPVWDGTDVPSDEIRPEVSALVNEATDLVEDLPETLTRGNETQNSTSETGSLGVPPDSGEVRKAEPDDTELTTAISPIDDSAVSENETKATSEAEDAPSDAGEASESVEAADRPEAAEEGAVDTEADDQAPAASSDVDDEPLLDVDALVGSPAQDDAISETPDEEPLLDLGEVRDTAEDVLERTVTGDDAVDSLTGATADELTGQVGDELSDLTTTEDHADQQPDQSPDTGGEAAPPSDDTSAEAPAGDTGPLTDLTDILDGIQRDEGAELSDDTGQRVKSPLGSLGDDVVEPLVENTTGTVSDLLHDTSDVLQSGVTDQLLGETLDDVSQLGDDLGLPVVGDSVDVLDGVVDRTVVPLVDGTLDDVGELTDVVILPLVDGTLLVVNELTGEVIGPLVDDTVGDVGEIVDEVVHPILPIGQVPQPPVDDIQPLPDSPEDQPGHDVTSRTRIVERPAERSADVSKPQAPHIAAATLPGAPSAPSTPAAEEASDEGTLTGSTSSGADGGSTAAGSASGGGNIGGVDLSYDAPVPAAEFLIVCQANAPPGLLERPRNPDVRPD